MPAASASMTRLSTWPLLAALALGAVLLGAVPPGPARAGARRGLDRRKVQAALARLPVRFEENRGQAHPEVQFLSRGGSYTLGLGAREAVFMLAPRQKAARPTEVLAASVTLPAPAGPPSQVAMEIVGARQDARAVAEAELDSKSNYYLGKEPDQWFTGIPNYARVRYSGIYPGIDLLYHGTGGELEYDFIVAPGADPGQIRLRFRGAETARISAGGDLVLSTRNGDVRHRRPVLYQTTAGRRRPVAGSFRRLAAGEYGFRVGKYDRRLPLVIDPVAYLGGEGEDACYGIVGTQNFYPPFDGEVTTSESYELGVVGTTYSPVLLHPLGPFQGAAGGTSAAFTLAFSLTASTTDEGPNTDPETQYFASHRGTTVIGTANGSTVARGAGLRYGWGLTVVGSTNCPDFPLRNPVQAEPGGGWDAFVAVPGWGGLDFSTLLGGSGDDYGLGVAGTPVSPDLHVVGSTTSEDYPTQFGVQLGRAGARDAFYTHVVAPNGWDYQLGYSTYLGGQADDVATGVAVDVNGQALLTGHTKSSDFPTQLSLFSFNRGARSGAWDAYVAQVNPVQAGAASLVYSTYLGGAGDDMGTGISLDGQGHPWITGVTFSTNYPVSVDAFQPRNAGQGDAFLTELDNSGPGLLYSTFYGGGGLDEALSVSAGPFRVGATQFQGIAIAGRTLSLDFPANDAGATPDEISSDAFVVRFNEDGSVDLAEQLGGSGNDVAFSVGGDLYLAGLCGSNVPNQHDSLGFNGAYLGGPSDGFIWLRPPPAVDASANGQNGQMDVDVIEPPTGLRATTLGSNQVQLSWRNRAADASHNLVQWKAAGGTNWTNVTLSASATSWQHGGAVTGVSYRYRVWALGDEDDLVDHSNVVTISTQRAPSGLKTTVTGSKSLTLSWVNNNPRTEKFEVERVGAGTTVTRAVAATAVTVGSTQQLLETGLAAETDYTYRVRSVDSRGYTSWSGPANASTKALAAPAAVSAVATSSTGVTVSWQDRSTAESSFVIERRLRGTTEFALVGTVGLNVTTFKSTVSATDVTYDYRVYAKNSLGRSDYSPLGSVVPLTPPDTFTATPLSSSLVELRWEDRTTKETGYRIERKTATTEYGVVKSLSSSIEVYQDRVPAADETYTYRLTAFNNSGVSNGVTTTATVLPAPTAVSATAVSSSGVEVTWTQSSKATSFRVERRTGATGSFAALPAGGSIGRYSDTVPAAEQTYYYRVLATRGTTVSSPSAVVAAVVLRAPVLTAATALSSTQVRLTWDDLSGLEGGYKVQYRKSGENWDPTNVVKLGAANVKAYTAGGLLPGTGYQFRVWAYNGVHQSSPSNVRSVTTLP